MSAAERPGPVPQLVFKTSTVVQPTARQVRLLCRSVRRTSGSAFGVRHDDVRRPRCLRVRLWPRPAKPDAAAGKEARDTSGLTGWVLSTTPTRFLLRGSRTQWARRADFGVLHQAAAAPPRSSPLREPRGRDSPQSEA